MDKNDYMKMVKKDLVKEILRLKEKVVTIDNLHIDEMHKARVLKKDLDNSLNHAVQLAEEKAHLEWARNSIEDVLEKANELMQATKGIKVHKNDKFYASEPMKTICEKISPEQALMHFQGFIDGLVTRPMSRRNKEQRFEL